MDCIGFGNLIRSMRVERQMTQKELADLLDISDKAVSKWERGISCPDISLLSALSEIFGVSIDSMLGGEIAQRSHISIDMKKAKFYVCPDCGNIILAANDCNISCCGKILEAREPKKASDDEKLSVEIIENDWFITSDHPMTKDDYISFAAFLTGSEAHIIKQYPEWNFQLRIQKRGHGKLVWYSAREGLMYQLI